jgi:hypothetical protein
MPNIYYRNEGGSLGKIEITGEYHPDNLLLAHEHLLDNGLSIKPPLLEVIDGGLAGRSNTQQSIFELPG